MSGSEDIRPASELFERLLTEVAGSARPELGVDRALRALEEQDGAAPAADAVPPMRAAVARAIDLYADLFRETFGLYADLVDLAVRGQGASVSAAGGAAPVALTGRAGAQATAPVWLHNGGETALAAVELRVTDLAAHDGAAVPGARAGFSPAALDIAAGASASSTLAVAVPDAAVAGAYHGLVLASGLPRASVPVLLVVE